MQLAARNHHHDHHGFEDIALFVRKAGRALASGLKTFYIALEAARMAEAKAHLKRQDFVRIGLIKD